MDNKDLEERFQKMNIFNLNKLELDELSSIDKYSLKTIISIIENTKIKILWKTMSNWRTSEKDLSYFNWSLDSLTTLIAELQKHYDLWIEYKKSLNNNTEE